MIFAAMILAPAVLTARVEGDGFLRFLREGEVVYQKEARLVAVDGRLAHELGPPVTPAITVVGSPSSLTVDPEGRVMADGRQIGRLAVALFGTDLRPIERDGWLLAADRPKVVYPGSPGAGVIASENAVAPPMPRPEAVVAGEILVNGPRISLAEVLGIDSDAAAKVDLGPAAAPGATRQISRSAIQSQIRSLGLSASAPESVRVVTRHQAVPHERFVQDAVKKLTETCLVGQISTSAEPDMLAPVGELELRVSSLRMTGRTATIEVEVWVDKVKFNARSIKFETTSSTDAFKSGQQVRVILRAAGATVEVQARIRSIDRERGLITVATDSGAVLTGTPTPFGAIEVTVS